MAEKPPKKIGALPAGPPIIMQHSAPPRRGCLSRLVMFALVLLAAPLVVLAVVMGLFYVTLVPARDECAAVAVGAALDDVEARLDRELGASRTGSGGLSGAPPSSVDIGVRGELLSWECHLTLDATGHVTSARYSPWLTPSFPGSALDPLERWLESLLPR